MCMQASLDGMMVDGRQMPCVWDTSGDGFCENENCRYSWLKSIRLHYYSLVRPSPCYSTWATVAAFSFRIFPFSCVVAGCFIFRYLISLLLFVSWIFILRVLLLFSDAQNSFVLFLFRTFNCCPEFEKAKLCAFERNNFNPFIVHTHTHPPTHIALTPFVNHPFNHPSQPNENWVT